MKTLVNKANPAIRITAPEIKVNIDTQTFYIGDEMFDMENWTLVEEEPVDLEKIALEKYPIQMVAKDPFDDEDDTKEDLNEYEREAYLEGLKKGYELGRKGGKQMKTLEQAAKEIAFEVCKDLPQGEQRDSIVYYAISAAIKGAEWQKKQMCNDCPNRGNTHSYLQGYEDGKKFKEQKNKEL